MKLLTTFFLIILSQVLMAQSGTSIVNCEFEFETLVPVGNRWIYQVEVGDSLYDLQNKIRFKNAIIDSTINCRVLYTRNDSNVVERIEIKVKGFDNSMNFIQHLQSVYAVESFEYTNKGLNLILFDGKYRFEAAICWRRKRIEVVME